MSKANVAVPTQAGGAALHHAAASEEALSQGPPPGTFIVNSIRHRLLAFATCAGLPRAPTYRQVGQAGLRSRKSAFGCRVLQDRDKILDHGDEPASDFGVAAQFKFGDIKEITNVTGLVRGHRDQ